MNRSIWDAADGNRLPDGAGDLRATVSTAESRISEVQAVNAMYTHGLLAIISTKRYGGFARAVGLRLSDDDAAWSGICEDVLIMVDEDVDPFNLHR